MWESLSLAQVQVHRVKPSSGMAAPFHKNPTENASPAHHLKETPIFIGRNHPPLSDMGKGLRRKPIRMQQGGVFRRSSMKQPLQSCLHPTGQNLPTLTFSCKGSSEVQRLLGMVIGPAIRFPTLEEWVFGYRIN